jgi:hypothetical protein
MTDLSATFHPAFTHLSATFPVAEIGVNPLKEKDLTQGHSEITGAERYGEKCVRVIAVSLRRVTTV